MPRGVKHVPTAETRKKVEMLTAFGVEQELIAAEVGLKDSKALRRNYEREIEGGTARMLAAVAASLFKKATDPKGGMPSVSAAIFILKARGQWRDQFQKIEVEGTGTPIMGGPTNVYMPDSARHAPPILEATPARRIESRRADQ